MIQPGGRSNLWQTCLTSGWKVSLWAGSRTEGCVLCWDENVVDQNFVAWLCLHKILQSLSFFSPVQEAILPNHCLWLLCVKEDGGGPWSLVFGPWLLYVKDHGGGGAVGAVLGQEGGAAKWRTRTEVCVLKVSTSWWISSWKNSHITKKLHEYDFKYSFFCNKNKKTTLRNSRKNCLSQKRSRACISPSQRSY